MYKYPLYDNINFNNNRDSMKHRVFVAFMLLSTVHLTNDVQGVLRALKDAEYINDRTS